MNNKEKRWYESFLLVKEHLLLGDESKYEWINNWIQNQRTAYKNRDVPKEVRKNTCVSPSDEKVKKLDSIGMIWDVYEEEWNRMYGLAKMYYEHYGNLKIPVQFKTLNGWEEDINGYYLGTWIASQRKAYANRDVPKEVRKNNCVSLSDEKVKKLDSIGMIWSVQKNKSNVIELCNKYNINHKKDRSVVNKSYNEVYVKICYLFDNNLPITINGEVHEIFNMSDVNMQVKYGVSLKDFLDKYIKGKTRGF